jgi:hypothetical protein
LSQRLIHGCSGPIERSTIPFLKDSDFHYGQSQSCRHDSIQDIHAIV